MLTWEEVVPVVVLVVVVVEVFVLVVEEALAAVVVAYIVGMLSFTSYKKGNSSHYRG